MATAAEDITPQGDTNNAPELSEVEQIAAEKGWKPKDQFAGDDTVWKPAADFLRHMPGTRDLKREIKGLKGNIDKIAATADRQVKREVQEASREIEARFAAAVEAKDTAGAAKAAQDMRELERDQAPTGETAEQRFQRDNPWYGVDEDATDLAIARSARVAQRGGTVEQQLAAAREAVHKQFPKLAGAKDDDDVAPVPKTPTLNSPARSTGRTADKTFGALPDAAKRAADRFYEAAKTRNPGKVPDRKAWDAQYARDFFAGQE